MIEALRAWKQTTQFSAQEDWIFASPAQIGRLPWSADSVRHADIRTTMNTYGEVVTDEMSQAATKVAGLALNGAQTERKAS